MPPLAFLITMCVLDESAFPLLVVLVYFRDHVGGQMLKLETFNRVKSCMQPDWLELGFTEHRFIWVR